MLFMSEATAEDDDVGEKFLFITTLTRHFFLY